MVTGNCKSHKNSRMNQLNAVIKSIATENNISLVVTQAAGIEFWALVIDNPQTASYLQEGKPISLVFKENAVAIGKEVSGMLTVRNRIPCTISRIDMGNVLSSIQLDCRGHVFSAVITTHSVKELNLTVGDSVEALIKTTDISLLQPEG